MSDPALPPALSGQGQAALTALRSGEVIAAATDTVYGILCNPADPAAVERVYALKQRPADLELTLLAAAAADLDGLVRFSAIAQRLAAAHWPGPLSLVLPVGERRLAVPRAGTTLSVRVPADEALLQLLRHSGPLASTSANRHGAAAATSARAVREQFGSDIVIVLDSGNPLGMASTIIDCSVTPPRVLREGPIDSHRLARFVQG